jgi:hypothetical protein
MKYKLSMSLAGVLVAAIFLSPLTAGAAISNWQKGASIVPAWDRDFESSSFQQSVRDLKNAGANEVTLIIPYYQSNLWSTDIHRGWNTPPDDSLVNAINFIHGQGMAVTLKPHIETYNGEWRANINPGDRDGWFRAYSDMLKHYASIAKDNNVEMLCIGAELISMSTYTSNPDNSTRWRAMIAEVRAIYSGKLTYSANWGGYWFGDEKNHIDWWDAVDYIGISAYFNLSGWSVEDFKNSWDSWNANEIRPLHLRYGKPILFTEIGYKSTPDAHSRPWDYGHDWGPDEGEQARLYQALFSYWNGQSYMMGVHLWQWRSDPNAGGSWDTSYTPQNKAAESIMREWWTGGGNDPTPTNSFNWSASANPSQPSVGQNTNISVNVTNNNGAHNDRLVDIEIYDANGSQVHQQVFEHQNWASGENKNFSVNWAPATAGTYKVKGGIFSSNWSSNISWNGDLLTISTSDVSEPPTGDHTIDIWWPTNGASVSGVQPFKAAIYSIPNNEFTMYWQVDGDILNEMYSTDEDYPHKEAMVDLSGWNWKGVGPYVLNFVAKNSIGETLGERSSSIAINP